MTGDFTYRLAQQLIDDRLRASERYRNSHQAAGKCTRRASSPHGVDQPDGEQGRHRGDAHRTPNRLLAKSAL